MRLGCNVVLFLMYIYNLYKYIFIYKWWFLPFKWSFLNICTQLFCCWLNEIQPQWRSHAVYLASSFSLFSSVFSFSSDWNRDKRRNIIQSNQIKSNHNRKSNHKTVDVSYNSTDKYGPLHQIFRNLTLLMSKNASNFTWRLECFQDNFKCFSINLGTKKKHRFVSYCLEARLSWDQGFMRILAQYPVKFTLP